MLKEFILQSFISGVVSTSIEQSSILCIILSNSFYLLVVISTSQSGQTIGVHLSAARIQLLSVILGQLSSEGVDCDDNCSTVGFKSQDLAHNVSSGATQILAELEESFQISLVQGISDDFNVHLIQVLLGNAINKEWSQRSVNQHGVVQLSWCSCYMNGLHLFEASQWVTLRDQLGNGSLMQSSSDQQNDVVNHVAVCDEVQESG